MRVERLDVRRDGAIVGRIRALTGREFVGDAVGGGVGVGRDVGDAVGVGLAVRVGAGVPAELIAVTRSTTATGEKDVKPPQIFGALTGVAVVSRHSPPVKWYSFDSDVTPRSVTQRTAMPSNLAVVAMS